MRRLYIFRHAPVVVDPMQSSANWQIAPYPQGAISELAKKLPAQRIMRVVSSHQTKAIQTATILASALNVTMEARSGFEEHHRDQEPYIPDAKTFHNRMKMFFDQPDTLIFGSETANEALLRFRTAINGLMSETNDDEVVVTHGTVAALFLGADGLSAYEVWRSLSLPDCRCIDWPPEGTQKSH